VKRAKGGIVAPNLQPGESVEVNLENGEAVSA